MEISVAPMEGVTTFPMRFWLSLASRPESMTTPFLRATNVYPEQTLPLAYAPELFQLRGLLSYHLTPQFLAAEPENFLRAVELIPPAISPVVEINCGCPSPNSAGRNAGSGILKDPANFGATIARYTRELGPGRLAVKMRVGFDHEDEFGNLWSQVRSLPLARLTIHGRTRADGYRGLSRWPLIEKAAQETEIPTWASGDVVGLNSYDRLSVCAPSVTGVMVGRGILRNPWVFEELRQKTLVQLTPEALFNALFAFVLLQELAIVASDKLITRLLKRKDYTYCGVDAGSWSDLVASLTTLLFRVPFVPVLSRSFPDLKVSTTAYERLRYLWQHLRLSLPEPFHYAKLARAMSLHEFATLYGQISSEYGRETLMVISAERV